jgi:hypothetical protein
MSSWTAAWSALLLVAGMGTCQAETLIADGVLGNSGEQGASLVRFATDPARGLGVVVDQAGSLWDRAGQGVLNRYAADGRMTGHFRIAQSSDGHDQLTVVGDLLVLLLGGHLYTLPISAASGSEAAAVGKDVRCISYASSHGAIAAATADHVVLLSPATGMSTAVAPIAEVECLELADDGIYAEAKGQLHRLVDGVDSADGWPRPSLGERFQLVDGFWYANAWHSTIRRYTRAFDPAPGVVLGGASGSFIGHLDANADLVNGRGLAHLWGDLYAISGFSGVLQLMVWHGDTQQFEVIRRISAVAHCPCLALDHAGNVYDWNGSWQWNDRPDSPKRLGISPMEELGQAVMLDHESMIAAGIMWGKPTFFHGKLSEEVHADRIDHDCVLKKGIVGTAVYRDADKHVLIAIDARGAAQSYHIDAEGHFHGDLGATSLTTATPVAHWTSLAMKNPSTLLAAGDGAVIEFSRMGTAWTESRRWTSWGTADAQHFGSAITLAADDRSLVIADGSRHRVLCFDVATGTLRSTFGTVDAPGSALTALTAPSTIAVNGRRVVVYDAGNQRLMKLLCTE